MKERTKAYGYIRVSGKSQLTLMATGWIEVPSAVLKGDLMVPIGISTTSSIVNSQ